MATFSPTTAYAHDWQYVDGVESAVLMPFSPDGVDLNQHSDVKAVEGPVSHPALLASAVGYRTRTAQITLWPLYSDSSPAPDPPLIGHRIRKANGDWEIMSLVDEPHGPKYSCLCSLIGRGGDTNEEGEGDAL